MVIHQSSGHVFKTQCLLYAVKSVPKNPKSPLEWTSSFRWRWYFYSVLHFNFFTSEPRTKVFSLVKSLFLVHFSNNVLWLIFSASPSLCVPFCTFCGSSLKARAMNFPGSFSAMILLSEDKIVLQSSRVSVSALVCWLICGRILTSLRLIGQSQSTRFSLPDSRDHRRCLQEDFSRKTSFSILFS